MYWSIRFRQWVKQGDHPAALKLKRAYVSLRNISMPAPKPFWSLVYGMYNLLENVIREFLRVFFWTPAFKSRLNVVGKALYLYGGMPYLSGPLSISAGNYCRICGKTTFSGRTASKLKPELIVGSNVDIGWMTTVAVGSKVVIGNNVRIAGQCFLAGYPGHPVDAEKRAAGYPDDDSQVGDIILEDDVWLATGVSVKSGVTIGKGTIVATGSVVTKNLPPFVLAGGNPAKVIKPLTKGGGR